MMRVEHPVYGEYMLVDLTQGQVEDFVNRLKSWGEGKPAPVYRRAVLECAIKAGWFETPPSGDMRDWRPAAVTWLSERVVEHFSATVAPTDEKN